MFDYLVIGKGLMGSAATRYLSMEEGRVGVIGPDEPTAVPADHDGIFASHYDQGRITRVLGKDLVWPELAHRSIEQYGKIEAESGIKFYQQVGCLFVSSETGTNRYAPQAEAIKGRFPVNFSEMDFEARQEKFPYLYFPPEDGSIFESWPAGYINPRTLILAQLAVAVKNGAEVIRETAVSLTHHADHITVTTQEGHSYQSKKVLLATGSYANSFDLLEHKLDLYVETETIILAEIPLTEVERLQGMPSIINQADMGVVHNFYMLPPVEYPDGRYYIKMGCNSPHDRKMTSFDEIQAWMQTGSADVIEEGMKTAVLNMIPNLKVLSWQTKRCLLTYPVHEKPFIGQAVDHLFVLTGGCGAAAKSSDAIGHLGAKLMINGRWTDELDEEQFRLIFQTSE